MSTINSQIVRRLEHLLEKNWGPPAAHLDVEKVPFAAHPEVANLDLLGLGLSEKSQERTAELFQRLRPYFEAGLHFRLQERTSLLEWQLSSAFSQGEYFPLLPEDQNKVILLSEMTLTEVRKLNTRSLFELLKLPDLAKEQFVTTLALRPTSNDLWVLFSELPDVFLKNFILAVQEKSLRLLSDFIDEESS